MKIQKSFGLHWFRGAGEMRSYLRYDVSRKLMDYPRAAVQVPGYSKAEPY